LHQNLNKALALDPNSAEAHYINAGIAVWTEFDWEKGEKEYIKALELNPNFAHSHIFYAHLLTILRRTDEALYHGKRAVELDPENPFTLGLYGEILMPAGKCQEALYTIEKALSIDPEHFFLQERLRNIYLCLGEYEKAFEEWKNTNADFWDSYGITESLEKTFHEQGWMAFIRELTGYNQGIMAEYIGGRLPFVLYQRYLQLADYDKAVDYLEIAYRSNKKWPNWPYISEKDVYDKLKGDPRYLAILKEMNLPVSEE
jgi:tetratricopeptide (TPR) repeat protein